jgi:hypothetical protein
MKSSNLGQVADGKKKKKILAELNLDKIKSKYTDHEFSDIPPLDKGEIALAEGLQPTIDSK